MPEKRPYYRLDEDFENYFPGSEQEARMWIDDDLPVPDRSLLVNRQFAETVFQNDRRTTVIINMIHAEYPDVYCQIQVIFTKKGEELYVFFSGPKAKDIPRDLVYELYDYKIRPLYRALYPQLFDLEPVY